jgi:putative hydrolase of the HAD superfamily
VAFVPSGQRATTCVSIAGVIRAVLFDFGGVVLSSPFEAFAHYEQEHGLPADLIRTINATNPHDNAWAHLERSDVSLAEFVALFEAEALELGHRVDGWKILDLLHGEIRPEMVEAIRRCREADLLTACLTNNFRSAEDVGSGVGSHEPSRQAALDEVMGLFDQVVESSKVGVRKPEPRFYEIALDLLGITAPEAVFLDDLGINLKPAKAMGMTTIKVVDPDTALAELEGVTGLALR